MILRAFSVRDLAVETFLPPFFVRHMGEAIRSFSDAVMDKNHQFAKHAADFVLYDVGEWDDASGMFTKRDPMRILSGLEVESTS